MLQSLREETEGKLQMLLSLRKNGLTSLFKEVRVFKESPRMGAASGGEASAKSLTTSNQDRSMTSRFTRPAF